MAPLCGRGERPVARHLWRSMASGLAPRIIARVNEGYPGTSGTKPRFMAGCHAKANKNGSWMCSSLPDALG